MSGLFANRAARRRVGTYVSFLVASVLLMAISANPLVRDAQNGIAFAFRPIVVSVDGIAHDVASIGAALGEIDQLRKDNEALRRDNEQLRLDNRSAAELRRENDQLTGLLQLRQGLNFETTAAAVIARETSEARRVIVIDRGSNDGLKVGHVVIAAGAALAGRVIEVGPTFARVLLISDSTSTVIGQLLSSAATGKVVGQPGGALVMQDVDSTVTVPIGEEVFTAGIELAGGIRSPYPKGLLIGQVVDVSRDPNEVVQTVYLQPAAPLDRLEFVLVITDYEGGLGGGAGESAPPCEPTASGVLPNTDEPCATGAPAP
ncbi:MAG TPA: rod shape-determining protein MreC [Candidatus Limnocylindrales bacterium]